MIATYGPDGTLTTLKFRNESRTFPLNLVHTNFKVLLNRYLLVICTTCNSGNGYIHLYDYSQQQPQVSIKASAVSNKFFNKTNKANTTTGNATNNNNTNTQSGNGGIFTENLSQPYANFMVKLVEINGTTNFSKLGEVVFFEQVLPAANVQS